MHAETLPAAAGWRWVTGGFAIFRRNPPLLSLLFVCYWLVLLFLAAFPVVGQIVANLLAPMLWVGMIQVARDIERGQPAGLQTLFGGFRRNPRALLVIGAVYLASTLIALLCSAAGDGGELARFFLRGEKIDPEVIEDNGLLWSSLIIFTVMLPAAMACWFAPLLVAWHGVTPGKALFFSLVACWRNRAPFLVFGIGLFVVAGLLPGMAFLVLGSVFPEMIPLTTALVAVPVMLMVAPALFASFYCTYRDIFAQADNA